MEIISDYSIQTFEIEGIKYPSVSNIIFNITNSKNPMQIYRRIINNEELIKLEIKKFNRMIVIPITKVNHLVALFLPNCHVPIQKKKEIFAKYDLYKYL